MKIVRRIAAVIIGLVLFTAGFMKIIDHVGTGLIVEEYFKFFGLFVLIPASKVLAVVLACVESLLGIVLVCGLWRKVAAVITAVILGIFTIITFILWICDPDMDCGCFGQFIHLSHLQSLIKNIVLCLLWVLAFIPFRKIEQPHKIKYVSFSLASAYLAFVCVYNLFSVPPLDFTPFHEGSELFGAGVYDNDNPILSFYDRDGNYCDSLALDDFVITVSVYNPDGMSGKRWARIDSFMTELDKWGINSLLLVASSPDEAPSEREMYFADPRTLVSLNRSNGGATVIRNGEIMGKCSYYHLPDDDGVMKMLSETPAELLVSLNSGNNIWIQASFLVIVALLLLL